MFACPDIKKFADPSESCANCTEKKKQEDKEAKDLDVLKRHEKTVLSDLYYESFSRLRSSSPLYYDTYYLGQRILNSHNKSFSAGNLEPIMDFEFQKRQDDKYTRDLHGFEFWTCTHSLLA